LVGTVGADARQQRYLAELEVHAWPYRSCAA
jgi:hypothetical protein